MLPRRRHELPPTAGLPLRPGDLRPGAPTLAADIAALLGTPPLQLECSGTASLLVALIALRELQPQRHRVVVPAFTCPLVAIAVRQAGLELQLCDLRHGHYDMDPAALRAACDARTLTGGGMCVYQAVEAFRLFTGIAPDVERMHATFLRALAARDAALAAQS